MLVVAGPLHKDLVVKVVEVLGHKDMDVAHYLQHIKTLCRKHTHACKNTALTIKVLSSSNSLYL